LHKKEDVTEDQPSVQRYIEHLKSANPRLRSHAAQELGKLEAQEAVPHLIEHLSEDVNTYVRSASAEALGHIGDRDAIFPLMDALHDSCSFVRRAAAISLGQMQAKEAQGALLQALNDHNFYVRRAAINAVGKLDIPDMATVLLPFLETDDSRIQRTTIVALRRLRAEQAVPRLIEMLASHVRTPNRRDLPVVKTLVVALGDLRVKAAVPVLCRVVRGYVGTRSLAAKALGKIGDPEAGPALVEALEGKSINLQMAALKSLSRLRYEAARPAVRPLLSSPDPRLRRTAAITLGYLQDHEVTAELLEMVRNDLSPLVRPAAVEALGMMGDRRLLPKLLDLVDDANAYLRAALVEALRALDGNTPEVRAALHQLAEDKVEHVAMAAHHALQSAAHAEASRDNGGHREGEQSPEVEEEPAPVSWLKRLLGRA
jgi:HEAT repeat protein